MPPPPPPPNRGTNGPIVIAIIAAGALLLVGGGIAWGIAASSGKEDPPPVAESTTPPPTTPPTPPSTPSTDPTQPTQAPTGEAVPITDVCALVSSASSVVPDGGEGKNKRDDGAPYCHWRNSDRTSMLTVQVGSYTDTGKASLQYSLLKMKASGKAGDTKDGYKYDSTESIQGIGDEAFKQTAENDGKISSDLYFKGGTYVVDVWVGKGDGTKTTGVEDHAARIAREVQSNLPKATQGA